MNVKRFATAVIMLLGILSSGGAQADQVFSIEDLNAAKKDWVRLSDSTLRVEGRIATHLKGQLRFQQCSLTFHLQPEHERQLLSTKNIEVTGRLKPDGNSTIFEVTDLRPLPTDIEQFRSREAALKNPQPDDWYQLSAWARKRGQFYNDKDLKDEAQACLVRGAGLELSKLAIDDYEGRFALADKGKRLGVPEAFVDDIRHEGYRAWWIPASSTVTPQPEMLAALEQRLKKEWPESLEPGSPFPTELSQRYANRPSDTYRETPPAQRPILRRIFGADVQIRRVQLQADPEGKNGREIAAMIEKLVPERKNLAEQYRDAELMYRLGQVDTASKPEALELARLLRERQRPKDAAEALLRWLVAKEQRLRPQSAPEFIELADEYLTLLKDESRAVALLIEAHRREPQSPDVLSRFKQLGYIFNGIAWTKQQEMPLPSADPSRTGSPTQLAAGMTTNQLTLLLGQPTSRCRIATAAGNDEFWIYGRAGEGSRLVIELRRATPASAYKVERFYSQ